ncbi:MAG TPA: xanthine dehydrogenase family protein molybdopterin-binding subunit [Candidatus Acidoferrales bacterium]|jgi:isoquinoline 1-oxidoreductase beta subunit|nr:xanthine dehydrogenase family protein molybdopterin-binding subunit [Candidatus Acidoferrales bacterium]
MSAITIPLDRRSFLKTGIAGATGLVIGFYLPGRREVLAAASTAAPVVLNAFIQVTPDDKVTILINKSEMGQGVETSLAMLAAEELECDWKRIHTEFAPAATVYFDPAFGMQGTGGSQSIHSAWEPMRKAGATARVMLIGAAAQKWGVDASECRAENGAVVHTATKRSATFGSLAEAAGQMPQPKEVKLKDPSQFTIVGKPTKRVDTPKKVNGTAEFGIDVRLPGMLHASVEHCPVFGGKVASFDATKVKAIPGVKDVIQIPTGVAVVADNTWTAFQARKALDIKWDEGPNAAITSASIRKSFEDACQTPGVVSRKEGDAAAALASAAQKIEAVYDAPYQAHCTMEPMNGTADVRADGVDLWVPTQFQTPSQGTAAGITGLKPDAVKVHTTYLGGGFGRRGWSDFVAESTVISKAMGAPVQVTWTREDDIQHDYYRPASYIKMSAGLDANGKPTAFTARVACDSIMSWFFPGSIKNGLDSSSVEGVSDIAYDIPNVLVDYHLMAGPIPMGFWRSVGASQNGFFSESFVDELAAAAKKDPYEFRRDLLSKKSRHLAVLNLAAEKAGWGTTLPKGRFRGIACLEAFSTYAAEVVEISLDKDGTVNVHRVVCAMDCGRVINPASAEAQVTGAVVYGITAALKTEITIDRGRVVQTNFGDNPMLRMNESPKIEVHFVPSEETPTGLGEPAVPPVAPAIANAIFAATGKRIRHMPIKPEDIV